VKKVVGVSAIGAEGGNEGIYCRQQWREGRLKMAVAKERGGRKEQDHHPSDEGRKRALDESGGLERRLCPAGIRRGGREGDPAFANTSGKERGEGDKPHLMRSRAERSASRSRGEGKESLTTRIEKQ